MSDFSRNYDATIDSLESRLSDLIDDGAALDIERKGDVLNIEFEDGEKIVITPQSPLEQLWVSANYAGHRFHWNGSEWTNEKGGGTLAAFLSDAISAKLGTPLAL